MTSEESYSGGKAELSQLALDQLQNGIYLTESEEVEVVNPITSQVTTERIVRVKLDKDGNRMRKSNTLASYGIEVTQLFFPDDFAYETKILEQIGNVRDAQMKATAAFARAEAAAQDEKTAAAEGRANVAKARAACRGGEAEGRDRRRAGARRGRSGRGGPQERRVRGRAGSCRREASQHPAG